MSRRLGLAQGSSWRITRHATCIPSALIASRVSGDGRATARGTRYRPLRTLRRRVRRAGPAQRFAAGCRTRRRRGVARRSARRRCGRGRERRARRVSLLGGGPREGLHRGARLGARARPFRKCKAPNPSPRRWCSSTSPIASRTSRSKARRSPSKPSRASRRTELTGFRGRSWRAKATATPLDFDLTDDSREIEVVDLRHRVTTTRRIECGRWTTRTRDDVDEPAIAPRVAPVAAPSAAPMRSATPPTAAQDWPLPAPQRGAPAAPLRVRARGRTLVQRNARGRRRFRSRSTKMRHRNDGMPWWSLGSAVLALLLIAAAHESLP